MYMYDRYVVIVMIIIYNIKHRIRYKCVDDIYICIYLASYIVYTLRRGCCGRRHRFIFFYHTSAPTTRHSHTECLCQSVGFDILPWQREKKNWNSRKTWRETGRSEGFDTAYCMSDIILCYIEVCLLFRYYKLLYYMPQKAYDFRSICFHHNQHNYIDTHKTIPDIR
jgi:hypothetical protein